MLTRGAYDAPGARVDPGTPTCLPPLPDDAPRNRLGLARWLTAPRHPLTARVAVNRIWQLLFGRGLVATPADFGSQGAAPTHPQLLDWLACEFVERGWSTKELIRTIVGSETYRRSSRADESARATDPDNIWLARARTFRWPAETIRDQALAVSGLLVERRGGPPARPYQPAGLWKEKSGSVYREDRGAGLYRRSLYTIWKRTSPPPSAMIFDAAKRDVCQAKRQRTNTPLQALVLLDDPQFVEAARVLATRMLDEPHADDRARVAAMFRALATRGPNDTEQRVLSQLLGDARASFAEAPDRARDLLGVGFTVAQEGHDPVELAAWTTIASTLFSYDAVVVRR